MHKLDGWLKTNSLLYYLCDWSHKMFCFVALQSLNVALVAVTCLSLTACVSVCGVWRWLQVDTPACYHLWNTRSNDARSNSVSHHGGWFLITEWSHEAQCHCCCWTSDYIWTSLPRCRLCSISRDPNNARLSHANFWAVFVTQAESTFSQTAVVYVLRLLMTVGA